MNNSEDTSIIIDDDDLIDDSLLAEFETSALKDFSSKLQTSNVNRSILNDTSELNASALCCDEEFSGFDKLTGKTWIYPNNYPVRDYQFNIIKAAIMKNTLVSLPTGLGKTFIAAVLMYNFYRWYPLGKIIFTAPTKPLIAQQIEACYNIIALPPDDTIEMTGTMNVSLRKENWAKKRVFFATPQVVYNDIKSGICPGKKIRCLVIDEAHKAKSNYAYCHIVSTLTEMEHRTYRILALSATPGSRLNDVIQVVKNLQISHLELRSENCIDVAPYCFYRKINTVVIPLDPELSALRRRYIEILDFYARKLVQLNILKSSLGNISKGRILMIYKEFQMNNRSHPQRSYILLDLSRLISLYHALELLVNHGSRSFLNFFDEHSDKSWMQSDASIMSMLEELRERLGTNPLDLNTDLQPDGSIPQVPKNLCFGHPKFTKVKEIMVDHFQKAKEKKEDTRAIVFCEYHETVKLVQCLLLQCRPLIKPRTFVGQGAGKGGRTAMPQREQLQVMRQFRAGDCNALVATCVAEEGLDVGSVDLIVCFDVATRSPVRLVQRCGRTGRERTGQVYFLVTEGKEHQILQDGMRQRDSMTSKIIQSKEVQDSLYTMNQRLIPYDITPRCEKMFITAKKQVKSSGGNLQSGKTNKNKTKKQSLVNTEPVDESNSPSKKPSQALTTFLSPKKEDSNVSAKPSVSPKVSPLKTKLKEKSKALVAKPNKKNADIRALFLAASKSNQDGVKIASELLSQNSKMSTQTLDLYFDLAMAAKTDNPCSFCTYVCDCRSIMTLRKGIKSNYQNILKYDYALPDINSIDDITTESILEYSKHYVPKNDVDETHNDSFFPSECSEQHEDVCAKDESKTISSNLHIAEACIKEDSKTKSSNCHIEEACIKEKSTSNRHVEGACIEEDSKTISRNPHVEETRIIDESKTIQSNFDIGDVDDIFVLSPREEEANKLNENGAVQFAVPSINFDLGSFDDLEDMVQNDSNDRIQDKKECDRSEQSCNDISVIDLSRDDSPEPVNRSGEPDKSYAPQRSGSPSILSGSRQVITKSPILTTQSRKLKLKRKAVNGDSTSKTTKACKQPDLSKSMLSITQTIDLINECDASLSITIVDEDDGRTSPIILTQADKKKQLVNNNDIKTLNKSSSGSTVGVNVSGHQSPSMSSQHKRKVDDVISSPYFNKKPRIDDSNQKGPSTLQDKIFAVLTSNDLNVEKKCSNDVVNLNYTTFIPRPDFKENFYNGVKGTTKKENDLLHFFDEYKYTPKKENDVVKTREREPKSNLNGKVSKKKKSKNSFIELEAELSGSEGAASADELTDDSAGSIADFITDEQVSPAKDMHALYLKSVKSPLKTGAFKIPQLPRNFKDVPVYSQFVEQDSYEMDSFCVDSHVGLTQANDLSTLELAEIILEEERRRKKKSKSEKCAARGQNDDSPVIKRTNRNARRRNVISDSEDSDEAAV